MPASGQSVLALALKCLRDSETSNTYVFKLRVVQADQTFVLDQEIAYTTLPMVNLSNGSCSSVLSKLESTYVSVINGDKEI